MEKFTENVKNNPNTAMFFDEINTKGISFGKIDEVSARIYAYLSAKGIGKEDFVLINLPRGVQPVVAIVGVWKTGAAFTIVEDNDAPERIEFITMDCGCKAEINKDTWEEIMNTEPKEGYVQADDHDAAFAIYTSGTTGKSQGRSP
jgi:acyl-coenzyme A synthetase/AMP-(fatty) acid ligase